MTSTTPARPAPPPTKRTVAAPRPPRSGPRRLVTYLLLSAGLLVMVAPFVWMALSAFKTTEGLSASPPAWLPADWTFEHFRRLFDTLDLPRYFLNSTVVATLVTAGNLVFCSMCGYALAKLNYLGRRPVFAVVLTALMVPGNLLLLPQFVLVSELGMLNSYAGLTLPFLAGAFGVFLMRQFMVTIPDELLEAARIDGAGEWYIFWRVVMPLVKPALATLAIFTFLGSWNNFLWPLVITNDPDKYTLPVAIATFAIDPTASSSSNGMLMAGAFVAVLPVLVVFVALQRYFTQGIATTGLK
ncbi:carbohydrate ABC transporter permease [Streptomyces sp. B6B3]|uniref:carbohydrate ABC transporter permease n=1 Tax=Streptomyces sp. B6B3 TaxID=3153570 RepID=UPI00325CCBFD